MTIGEDPEAGKQLKAIEAKIAQSEQQAGTQTATVQEGVTMTPTGEQPTEVAVVTEQVMAEAQPKNNGGGRQRRPRYKPAIVKSVNDEAAAQIEVGCQMAQADTAPEPKIEAVAPSAPPPAVPVDQPQPIVVTTPATPPKMDLALAPNNGLAVTDGKKPMTMAQRLAAALAKKAEAPSVGVIVRDAKDLESLDSVKTCVTSVLEADDYGIPNTQGDGLEENARERWEAMTFKDLVKQLQIWEGEGDSVAAGLAAVLAIFAEASLGVSTRLWRLITNVVRPAKNIRTETELRQLLDELKKLGIVTSNINQQSWDRRAVLINTPRNTIGYWPILDSHGKMSPGMEVCWPYVQEAKRRFTEEFIAQRHTDFQVMATKGAKITPAEVLNLDTNREVRIFLKGKFKEHDVGALLCLRKNRQTGQIEMQFQDATGIKIDKAGWKSWDTPKDGWPAGSWVFFVDYMNWKQS